MKFKLTPKWVEFLTLEQFREQVYLIRARLNKNFIYKLSKDYGLITENTNKITFYFEEVIV